MPESRGRIPGGTARRSRRARSAGSTWSAPRWRGRWRRSSTRTSSWRRSSSPTTTAIDGRYLEVHQALITLLATQSPVATDLRLISALLHVLKNIERMGDQCVNICKVIPMTGTSRRPTSEMVEADPDDGRADADR